MKERLVSVIIPVYNAEKYILEAIDSVYNQQYPEVEIIVVDDGSTDKSITLIEETYPNVKITSQENAGPAAARNRGIQLATGDFITFLDADDLFPTNKFEIQLGYLNAHPETEFVAGRIQYLFLEGAEKKDFDFESDDQTIVHVHLGSIMARRPVFEKVGLFNHTLQFSEDIDWWLRIREKEINYVIMPDITLHYRLHDKNMTFGVSGIESDFMKALKMSLARRRETGKMHLKPLSEFDLKNKNA